MSLERRAAQMRQEMEGATSPYDVVLTELRKDSKVMLRLLQGSLTARDGGAAADPIDEELNEVYELKPADVPTLSLPGTLQFFDGFSYVVGHWYPIVTAIGSGKVTPNDEHIMDEHLQHLFPRLSVTTQEIRKSLGEDSSGASWLNQKAEVEFDEGHLALIGAKTAILGARKMYDQLVAST